MSETQTQPQQEAPPPKPVAAKKSKLSLALAKYRDLKKQSEVDLERVPPSTRGGHAAAKEVARQALPAAIAEYQQRLEKLAFSVWVEGEPEHVQAFVAKSRSRGLLCLDTMDLYRILGERACGSIGATRIFGATQLAQLVNDVREFIFDNKEVDDSQRPEPHLVDLLHVPTDEAALLYVREVMRRSSGDILNRTHLRKKLTSLALESGYEQPVVPVLFHGFGSLEEVEALKFLPNEDFRVEAVAESSQDEEHLRILNQIRDELMKKRRAKK